MIIDDSGFGYLLFYYCLCIINDFSFEGYILNEGLFLMIDVLCCIRLLNIMIER
jgi:hypothetical protein